MTEQSVCNLPAAERAERAAMIRAEILPRVRARRELFDGIAWDFESTPELVQRLEDWIALERECCASLDWRLESGDPNRLVLLVRGAGAKELFARTEPAKACD